MEHSSNSTTTHGLAIKINCKVLNGVLPVYKDCNGSSTLSLIWEAQIKSLSIWRYEQSYI